MLQVQFTIEGNLKSEFQLSKLIQKEYINKFREKKIK